MTDQTYQIRKNRDGNMIYWDAKELVDLCLDNNLLQGEKGNWIAVYCMASKTQPEIYPEGWYRRDYDDCIQELMADEQGIHALMSALSEHDILFVPSLNTEFFDFWLQEIEK